MYYYTAPSYIQAKSIKFGESRLPPFWQKIVDWVGTSFGVGALNIELECDDEHNRQDIYIILERTSDCNKLDQYGSEIATYIMPLLYSPERPTDDETKNGILPWRAGRQYDCHIDCHSFEKIFLMDISNQLNFIVSGKIKRKYPKVIETTTANSGTQYVFYKKDADIVEGQSNGVSDDIIQMYFDALKGRDKFGYFTIDDLRIIFDSQETLDRDHGGNTGYYFR